MKGIFVVGTGIGVGKTIVTAGIVRALRNSGIDAVPAKPIQTGCIQTGTELMAPDLEYCLAVAGVKPLDGERELMCPYRYRPACSPHLAGRLSGVYAAGNRITTCLDALASSHDMVVAESIGGVLTPMNESRTMLDLVREIGWPILLVASGSSGTINHTLLSLAVLRNSGLQPEGVVVNHWYSEPDMTGRDNRAAIERFGNVTVLAEVPFVDNFESDDIRHRHHETFKSLIAGLGISPVSEALGRTSSR